MSSQFAQAWDNLAGTLQNAHTVQTIEYREHQLLVKIKSNTALPLDSLKAELSNRGLNIVSSSDNVLKINSVSGENK